MDSFFLTFWSPPPSIGKKAYFLVWIIKSSLNLLSSQIVAWTNQNKTFPKGFGSFESPWCLPITLFTHSSVAFKMTIMMASVLEKPSYELKPISRKKFLSNLISHSDVSGLNFLGLQFFFHGRAGLGPGLLGPRAFSYSIEFANIWSITEKNHEKQLNFSY